MMRYIHSKEWDARLIDALITEHMKPNITEACPNIQIEGMPERSIVEHLVTLKTWMKMKDGKKKKKTDFPSV